MVCALSGANAVVLSFLTLGLLQAIAGATLSMLLRHIRRYFVIGELFFFYTFNFYEQKKKIDRLNDVCVFFLFDLAVGFAFHACLLLVLITWRPAGDDPALFHVISAAWGVCNAIWETLIYSKKTFSFFSPPLKLFLLFCIK